VEKAILLENNLDELHAISWQKGCYMGQELTARTRYRGLVRKRLFPVIVEGTLPEPGTTVMLGDKEAGEMRSGSGDRALALLRLEEIERAQAEGPPLLAGDAKLTPVKPGWVNF
jgi:folate-binding protein YgfZ